MENEQPATPPGPAGPDLAADAKTFLQNNFDIYRNRGHPEDARVVQAVRAQFSQAHPGVEWDGTSTVFSDLPDLVPQAVKPSEKSPEPPTPPAPPTDPLDRVPPTPDGYTFSPPDAPPGETWDPTTWPAVLADAHAVGLSQKQAASWALFVAATVLPKAMEGGFDLVATESLLGAAAQRLKWLGVPSDKAKVLLQRGLERMIHLEARPPVDTSGEESRQRELMSLPEYRDAHHPRHAAVAKEIRQLAEAIVAKKPIQLYG